MAVQALMPGGAGYNDDTKQPETGAVYFDCSLRLSLSPPAVEHLSFPD